MAYCLTRSEMRFELFPECPLKRKKKKIPDFTNLKGSSKIQACLSTIKKLYMWHNLKRHKYL